MTVEIKKLTKIYGDRPAIDELELTVADGEFLVLLGPSGCGKTTAMRSVVGLETPEKGSVTINGNTVFDADTSVNVPIHKRHIGMVFQSYAIWPHMTVAQNVEFPLKMLKASPSSRSKSVKEILELVGLSDYAARPATNLSGGQMQRVALARSLVMEPQVLLLDEPLSNLDAQLRERLRFELKEMHHRLGHTSIYVTHDQAEALAMADRIVVMNQGRIEQQGSPTELYGKPRSSFVARFLGSSNVYLLREEQQQSQQMVTARGAQFHSYEVPSFAPRYISVRPESVRLVSEGSEMDGNVLRAKVMSSNYLGSQTRVHLELESEEDMFAVLDDAPTQPKAGDNVLVHIPRHAVTPLEA